MKRILSFLLIFVLLFSLNSYAATDEDRIPDYLRIYSEKFSRKTYITLNVTEYVRYPDKVTLELEKDSVLETGNTVKFNVKFYPEDTTERRLHWQWCDNRGECKCQ